MKGQKMKKLFLIPILLITLVFNAWSAPTKKSGRLAYENYISLASWTFDSLKIGSADTVRFYQDSASTSAFAFSAIGRAQQPQPSDWSRMPDSVQFLITSAGEADAVSVEFKFFVSTLGQSGLFTSVGTPDTLTMTGATKATAANFITVSRKFYPGGHFYGQVTTTTSTDTSRVYKVLAIPVYR